MKGLVMKKTLSPKMIILVIAVVVIVLSVIFMKTAGPGKNAAIIDDMMKNGPMSGVKGGQVTQQAPGK
jgi:hypothetical protein